MSSRAVRVMAAVTLVPFALAACSSGGSSSPAASSGGGSAAAGEKATIKFLAPEYSDKTGPYWKELIGAFQKETPISPSIWK